MASFARMFALPPSILLLVAASAAVDHGPQDNRPAAAAHWARDEALIQRTDADIQKRFASAAPVGVRKMSGDEGEKFFLDYWQFDDQTVSSYAPSRRSLATSPHGLVDELSNVTIALPPYLLHEAPFQQSPWLGWLAPRMALAKRFQCPSNTQNCSSIDRPNSCCALDEACVIVDDTGLGDVGCCPAGEQCGGQVSSCDTAAGYSSCPDSDNGGCCIPNYTCMGIGCITVGGAVTTTTLPLATVTSGQASSSSSSTTSEALPTVTTTTTIGSSGTATALPPGRPTGDASSSSSTSSSTSTTSSSSTTRSSTSATAVVTTYTSTQSGLGGACPTGFYQCSAYYGGGCCRVGRDCQSTSCPIPATQTVIISNGVTIVAGSGSTPAPPGTDVSATATTTGTTTILSGGSCANGWYSCAVSDGGGCCPSGYACGTICTATIAGAQQSTVEKISIGPKVELASWITWSVTAGVSLMGMLLM